MPAADRDTASDARAKRLYVGVLVCEALTIVALWVFEQAFR